MPPPGRLNSWKEIAAYFGKAVRTVQRWEAELGMPVHRMGTGRGQSVWAFGDELDRWRESTEASADGPGRETSVWAETSAIGSEPEPPAEAGSSEARVQDRAPDVAPPLPGPPSRRRSRTVLAAVSLVAVAALGIAVWLGSRAPTSGRQPASYEIAGNTLRIFDRAQTLLWEKRFDFRLTEGAYGNGRQGSSEAVVMDDIDGDGNVEVLFVSEPTLPSSRGLFCFTAMGDLRFHHQPQSKARFGDVPAGPPWRGAFVKAVGDPGHPHNVWFVSFHVAEFPTIVEKLDPDGNVRGTYWSNGQVQVLEEAVINGERLVLLGGVSNEFRGASLAVLEEADPTATAPASSDHYTCYACPPIVPRAFLVFPRLDVARVVADYSRVPQVRVDEEGHVMLLVAHGTAPAVPNDESAQQALSLYTLDGQFRVVSGEVHPKYAAVHAIFERKGLLDHRFGLERDGRDLWPVLRWDGGRFVEIAGPEPDAR